ncbi:MAG: 4-hydroxy-tetrahydrodipicolinate reductase [Clostridium sp.]|nr:4-hydroxy-tetrahydrodipicolinate reductase [Clostridium sp.]
MVRAVMHGCSGAMGRVITDLVKDDKELAIVAGVDISEQGSYPYPVYKSLDEVKEEADVIIDFSSARAADGLLDYCARTGMAVVLCTTGLSETQTAKAAEVSQKAPVLRSANMSLGVNTLLKLLKEAAPVLYPAGFDVEIVEKHHNKKIDAPSGTALALADAVNESLDNVCHYKYDRFSEGVPRDSREIGIQSVRGGTIVGEHDVIFAGTDEVITFTHTAYSKAIFAKGAIQAAKFLGGKPAGLYSMADVIG